MAILCHTMGRFHGPCEHFTYELPMNPFLFYYSKLEFYLHSNSICTPFHLCCDISNFTNLSSPFFYISLVMKNGLTCPLIIWLKLCITSNCRSWKTATLICTQQCLTTTFMFSNNLHYIDNIGKVVHLVMVSIGMNCCWGGPKSQVILLNLS